MISVCEMLKLIFYALVLWTFRLQIINLSFSSLQPIHVGGVQAYFNYSTSQKIQRPGWVYLGAKHDIISIISSFQTMIDPI